MATPPATPAPFEHARFADIERDEDAAIIGHVGIGRDTVGTIRDAAGLFTYEQHDAPGPPGEFRPLTPGERASLTVALSAFVASADPPADPLWREMLADLTALSGPPGPQDPEPSAPFDPNLFDLEGNGVKILYQTTTFAGPPEFTFEGPEGRVTRKGSDIEAAQTALGTEVTILLRAVPDLEVVTVTLVLPSVALDGDPQPFATFAVETTGALHIGGPGHLGPGPLATYRIFELSGAAQFVTP